MRSEHAAIPGNYIASDKFAFPVLFIDVDKIAKRLPCDGGSKFLR
jgi:hypothetical protein